MNRLAGCLAGFLPDVTSDAELQPPDMDRAFGETAAAQIKGWMEREAAARSARTQRSSRSSRGWTTGAVVVQGFRSGLSRNGRVECRVDSVKHSTSPSRRENARRAITPVFSKPACHYRTSACSIAAPPRISVCRLQHVHELRVPNCCIVGRRLISPALFPLSGARLTRAPRREI